jgi:hypothetical protein
MHNSPAHLPSLSQELAGALFGTAAAAAAVSGVGIQLLDQQQQHQHQVGLVVLVLVLLQGSRRSAALRDCSASETSAWASSRDKRLLMHRQQQ